MDPGVASQAFRRAQRFGATPRELLALAMAGLVESNFTALRGGDRDSTGFLQQRPSQGWGPVGESVGRDTVQFLRAARNLTNAGFKGSAGALAQAVQRSAFPKRYDERRVEARELVQRFAGGGSRGGGGGNPLLGLLGAPEGPGARALPQGSAGLLPLLQALGGQQGPSQAPSAGVPAPAFSAGPVMPQGMQVPVSSGGPARRPDVSALLSLIGAQGGDVAHAPVPGVQALVGGRPAAPGGPRVAGRSPTGGRGKVIGTPYAGTHNLGNWQSDNAVDIRLPEGSPIYSTGAGKVVKVHGSYHGGGGRFDGVQVTIQTPAGQRFYTHLSSANVKPGQRIKRGQQIGLSGAANGVPHLHFAAQERDPRSFVR